ncbi:TlpA family protein disulfide reductase [Algibacter miyuki]|uniref:TlpA family protein disulfide reductase n=1 Tax=Algibacter miyuki TaxID=1306933 RepID=A0ABV5H2R4_9FLAO|nr:TlpA disulfide reductase family protein [Algibacter miyuki]MDN3663849.1 TlpA disulfide reductase family protein [Algibacter miyuki]
MKNIFILIFATFLIVGCNESPKKEYILFSGTIIDATKDFRLVKRFSDTDSQISIKLTDNGSFVADTITFGTGRYVFTDGRNSAELYLTNGEEYHLTAIAKNFINTVKLTGPDSGASNYLISKVDRIKRLRGDYVEYNSLDEAAFLAKQKELHKTYVSYLDSFPNMPKEFEEIERKELYYNNLLSLTMYERLHKRYTDNSDFKVSDDFLAQLDKVDNLSDEAAYKSNGSYKSLVDEHYKTAAKELSKKEGVDWYLAKLKVFETIPNDFIKNSLLLSVANADIEYTDKIDEYYKTFMAVSTSTNNNKSITERYKSLKKLSTGEPSPVFTDYVNHGGGTSSLGDFKGKYVYIDIWATWCAPCLKQVPYLKKVEKQYHGKNIQFVSISIDKENAHNKWRKMVTDEEFVGVQLLADNNRESEFVAAYQADGLPRFILIDPEGNIVDSNAPRPSSQNLIKLFNELNI